MKLDKNNKLLIIGFCLALYICYIFAFSNTMEYYSQYQAQKELMDSNLNDPGQLKNLLLKEQQIDEKLLQYSAITGVSFQNELLKQLSVLCERHALKIIDFKEPHIFAEKNIKTYSYVFSLQGGFNSILLLINTIENNRSLGYIKNITFIKNKNYKTGKDYLTAEVILQKSETINSAK